jgi:mono/diheme cytochrome c family protein
MTRSTIGLVALGGLAVLTAGAAELAVGAVLSVWDGAYTLEQVERGRAIYAEPCGKCHGYRLDGAPDDADMFSTPPVAGPKFLRDWDGRTLAALYEYSRTTMPANNPGSLTRVELADVLAYMLFASGLPAGANELSPETSALAAIVIERTAR